MALLYLAWLYSPSFLSFLGYYGWGTVKAAVE
jgi:TM2 domain-containing membrane protein YozV